MCTLHRSSAHLPSRSSSFAHVDYCPSGHFNMWTIVDMFLCNATHITLHRTRVLYNMEEVKKSTRSITAIVITTEHKSSATWKQFKKESVQSVRFLSPQNTSPLQHGSSLKRNLCNQCNSCHQSTQVLCNMEAV